ncbi:hypothetical protein BY458DRAFT_534771 [Sporodiniella umbellata]|nr:hypothetical protein BY458DRAFT_534771 [Sporodiniella umbellata]
MASHLSCQRASTFGTGNWYQWQEDNSEKVLRSLKTICLHKKPIYYKRIDTDTLQAMIEFEERANYRYYIVLALEDGNKTISNMKYHNIVEICKTECSLMFGDWSRSSNEAEERFLTRINRRNQIPIESESKAPEDYWGDWSSDESTFSPQIKPIAESQKVENLEDNDDEYYVNWSKNPGTLTPGPEDKKGRILSSLNLPEASPPSYEASNKMDPQMIALSQLTLILQNTIPQQCHSVRSRPVALNILPKAVYRAQHLDQSDTNISKDAKEADRQLLMKSLCEIVEKAKSLGYKGSEILDMVQVIVQK